VLDDELLKALAPVKEHFWGEQVNPNTVLAAHLRSKGLKATGASWDLARSALSVGRSFEEAVEFAVERLEERPNEEADMEPTEAASYRTRQHSTDSASGSRKGRIDWTPTHGRAATTVKEGSQQSLADQSDFVLEDYRAVSSLERYSPRFTAGAFDGHGAKRLLGTPDLDPTAVLVRETVQNAWDAGRGSDDMAFTINLRRIDSTTVGLIERLVLDQKAPSSGQERLFEQDSFWVLEIHDRGTVGLGGPIRNDLASEPGQERDFVNFVFNAGVARDVDLGGGTYGFGKTISYIISAVGTILVWSQIREPAGFSQRLIGSAINDSYNMHGYRHTGRHWWGILTERGQRVEPALDDHARYIGERIFSMGFGAHETGTSLMILDPKLDGDSADEKIDSLRAAVLDHVWPKLVPEVGRRRMDISIQLDGVEVPLSSVDEHPKLSGHAAALRAVRAVQGRRPAEVDRIFPPVKVREIRHGTTKRLLGHLALTRFPIPRGITAPSQSVTLMRHDAELVVKEVSYAAFSTTGIQWAGVFKPVAEVDDSFAQSEPPAHDDWVPKSVPVKARASEVRVALSRIDQYVNEYIRDYGVASSDGGQAVSGAVAGDALAGLISGVTSGGAPTREQKRGRPSSGGRRRLRRPQALITDMGIEAATTTGRMVRRWIQVEISGVMEEPVAVLANTRVGVDGASEADEEAIATVGWFDLHGTCVSSTDEVVCAGDQKVSFVFDTRADLAIDVSLRIKGA